MAATRVANLEEKTGKSLDPWQAVVAKRGESKHGAIVKPLKAEHDVTHGYANLIAAKALEGARSSAADGDPADALDSGKQADLRPIHDHLVAAVAKLGPDVELAWKLGYRSLRRSKQFAPVQPSTATRVDVGSNGSGSDRRASRRPSASRPPGAGTAWSATASG